FAGVAELADAPDLGSGGEIRRGSSPLPGTPARVRTSKRNGGDMQVKVEDFSGPLGFGFWEGRMSGTVCGWLRDAGFGNVVDNVKDFPGNADLRDNLAEAEKAVTAKKLVIFAIQGDLVKKLQQGKAQLAQFSGQPHKSGAGMASIGVGPKSLEPRTNP